MGHHGAEVAVLEDCGGGVVVVGVPAAAGIDVAPEIGSEQGEVADAVEDLVSGTFVGVQEVVVDGAVVAENQQVLVGQPLPEALVFQGLDLAVENERAAAGDAGRKVAGVGQERSVLRTYRRVRPVVEVVAYGQAGPGQGSQRELFSGGADRQHPVDDQAGPRSVLDNPSRFEDRLDDRTARSVEARWLGGVQGHQTVVDLQAGQRGKDVLNQLDDHSVLADCGATLPGQNRISCGWDRRRARTVKSLEGDPETWFGRVQGQFNLGSGHESDAVTRRRASERVLGTTGSLRQRRQVVSGVSRHAGLCEPEVVRNGRDADHPVSFTE